MYMHSVAAYGDEIVDNLPTEELAFLRGMSDSMLSSLHLSWGMSIRNECGLWGPNHPLTSRWHKFPDQRNIVNGIDCSDDHPDAISMAIIRHVYKKVNA